MQSVMFQVIRSDDREMVEALKAMISGGKDELACQNVDFTFLSDGNLELKAAEISNGSDLEQIISEGVRLFRNVRIETPLGSVNFQRHGPQQNQDNNQPFDIVQVAARNKNPPQPKDFVRLVGFAQKHLGKFSVNALNSYLGEDSKRHFEARDIALARLEELIAKLTRDLEVARKAKDEEIVAKEKTLETRYENRHADLEKQFVERQGELDKRVQELDEREANLNLQAAKAERRQVRQDLKKTLKDWSEKFEITTSTRQLRVIIHAFSFALLILFGTAAGIYINQSIQQTDTAQLIWIHIKQGLFTVLFVTTAIFYARWNTHWFHKRANEEFRLKRMELDFDRASWFVELAFQWKEEHEDEPLPAELVERLTAHLFTSGEDQHPTYHPYEALGAAILGASSKVKVGPSGAEVEFDRKGIRQLKKAEDA